MGVYVRNFSRETCLLAPEHKARCCSEGGQLYGKRCEEKDTLKKHFWT